MKSQEFSKFKTLRSKNSCTRDVKHIKTSRVRKDRRHVKQVLHHTHDQDAFVSLITLNNGSWEIV